MPAGRPTPLLGKDISFYLLSLPIYTLIQKEVLVAFIILLVGVVFLYWYESRLLAIQDQTLPRRARVHVSLLPWQQWPSSAGDFCLNDTNCFTKRSICPSFSAPATSR